MSHLRAPADRADRRDGGARHGRPGSPLPESHIRTLLLRTAVLPALAVALSGTAAVLLVLGANGHPGAAVRIVLAVAAGVALAALGGAVLAARRATRTVLDRIAVLRSTSARRQSELRGLVDRLRRGEVPPVREAPPRPDRGGDGLDLLGDELGRFHDVAMASVVQASQLSSQAGSEQKVEVFVNLARRLQSLVHREIQLLDELEQGVEDPALLKGLFHVDHLATRTRRHAENLAVLGGAHSRRQWSRPVTMTEVLRSAVAEVEQYARVKLVPPVEGTLRGQVVADVIHLLAELVENATLFSAPHTPVLLRAGRVAAGLAVEVEDRGLGLPVAEQHRMNTLLCDPDQVNMASLLQDGRIGLYVVATLARRHGIAVRLQSNIYGGVQAVLVLPSSLLGEEPDELEPSGNSTDTAAATSGVSPAGRAPALTAPTPVEAPAEHPDETEGPERPDHPEPPERPEHPEPARPPAPPLTPTRPAEPVRAMAPDPLVREPAQDAAGAVRTPGRASDDASAGSPPPLPVRGAPGPPPSRRTPYPSGEPRPTASPLPVRGAGLERPNPAEARPGVRPGTSAAEALDTGAVTALTLRDGSPVRGAARAPGLPKRRAQTHMVPQLRGGPAPARTGSDEEEPAHDPGLMAAFRQGFGRGEAADEERPEDSPRTADPTRPPGPRAPGSPHTASG